MAENTRLAELLDQWESLRGKGQVLSPDELCRDCPDLAAEAGHRIRAIEAINRLIQSTDDRSFSSTADRDDSVTPAEPGEFPSALGRYRLDEVVGQGGFGQVWRGFDPELQRQVAIKVPRPDRTSSASQAQAFLREARKVACLKHPGIVAVHDVGREGPYFFIVSDWIDGTSLAQMTARGRLGFNQTAAIIIEVAQALHFAHLHDIVHRDIKPGNILLDAQNRAYLTDFGIAVTEDELVHEPGTLCGTPAYMSPEQIRGENCAINARTDIYSLGVVLYELLTGRLPFRAKGLEDIRRAIVDGEPRPPRTIDDSIPIEVETICLKAMSKRPADRFSTAKDMAASLQSTCRGMKSFPAADGAPFDFGSELPRDADKPATAKTSTSLAKLAESLGLSTTKLMQAAREVLRVEIRTPSYPLSPDQIDRLREAFPEGRTGRVGNDDALRQPPLRLDLGAGVVLEMRMIPAGTFVMGSPPDEEGHNDDEIEHEVSISRPFYMGQYLVTQEQFERVMDFNPSYFRESNLPVEMVAWFDSYLFCEMLTKRFGRPFRLPTEAEWEYACRAGTTTPFHTGAAVTTQFANFDGKFTYGNGPQGLSRWKTTPVDAFPPNPWNLHDMHGNVWEWCGDWYGHYDDHAVVDPTGPAEGDIRVLRGGSWFHGPADCRSAQRDALDPGRRHSLYGFRVVTECMWESRQ